MRGKLAALVAALVVAAGMPATAGPLDPPSPPRLVVALFEPDVSHPAPLKLRLDIAATQDDGVVMIVGFKLKGKRRLLLDGMKSAYIEARRGGIYPSVTMNGSQQVPPCTAQVLCTDPTFPPAVEQHVDLQTFNFQSDDAHVRYYVFVNDVPNITLTPNAGWRRHDVKGGQLLQFRDPTTDVRINAEYKQYGVEDFRGVTAPRVNGPSVAFAAIPCWFWPVPGGSGKATLRSDGKASSVFRIMDCSNYTWAAMGGSDQPTVWRNDGASVGWSGGQVNRLVIAVLPPS